MVTFSSTLESYTQRVVSAITGGGGLTNHEDWDKVFIIIREVYSRGENDGFDQCKNKMRAITKDTP